MSQEPRTREVKILHVVQAYATARGLVSLPHHILRRLALDKMPIVNNCI